MTDQKVKTCPFCKVHEEDVEGCVYPYYGLAPHIHTKPIGGTEFLDKPYPSNFSPDGDGMGVYTHCLYCGGDGTVEGVVLEKEEG
ncbi:hypothetical protein F938_00834 [Acinetobacter bereziniae LMG 1003 = CIP 70.12]|uniref:Uncharacterized protein n=1 Tax=Acinetobacter bereziniae LMG 1003 = CIP 70.12 TaxID=981324 RepID=N9EYW4_ACIBZ|nr:hypothetical protein [Acinetobacter bereziniae]ENW00190.1 hypothetical protein F938_00834 [Acinetobacter bereziniae LMG 1003 = CIP 70.12]